MISDMAVVPHRQVSTVVVFQTVHAANQGNVELLEAQKNVTVLPPGSPVKLPNNSYIQTNYYIQTSRSYIPGRTLRTYWYIRFMRWAFIVYISLSFPMLFVPTDIGWPWALVAGVLRTVWLVIFGQHAHVVCWTIPKVLSQPIVPDSSTQGTGNAFHEIKVEHLKGAYLQAKDAGVGISVAASGSIQFQVLNKSVARNIGLSALSSIVCLIVTIIALCASVGIFVYGIVTEYS